ncbi:MAG: Gfo/Idh/MocA family protein [Pseudomonadales bacterium]
MIRIGIIGLGNIARQHISNLLKETECNAQLTAICSRSKPRDIEAIANDRPVQWYSDYRALLSSGTCDAVLIATPSYSHLEIGLAALAAGLHVLMEKPIALSIGEAQQLMGQARSIDQPQQPLLGVMLNQRVDPLYQRMKQLLDQGEIGSITRTHWTMTNWFRPEVYFRVSDWRATWRGEGGGLLLNQCIHNLDIFQWLCSMPVSLQAYCEFGKYHAIEVEDETTAFLQYSNGATGVFVGSSGEAPGFNRLEIVGDGGNLVFDGTQLLLTKNQPNTSEYCNTTTEMFGTPKSVTTDITPDRSNNQHAIILGNFVAAINGDEALIASAEDGIQSLELANAMLLSSWTNCRVQLPLNVAEYQVHLNERVAHSSLRSAENIEVDIDISKSFR